MTEKYSNNAATTLNGAINNSVTSLTVTSASGFPSSGNFRIEVDSEIMLVTAASGTTFTVTRASEGTSAASHSSGAAVTHVFTAGAIDAIRGDQVSRGVSASRPTGQSGDIYLETDCPVLNHQDGSSWSPFGPLWPLTAPVDGNYSWTNQGSATLAASNNAIRLNSPSGDSGFNMHVRRKAAPSTPYTITAAFLWQIKDSSSSNALCGLCFRQSSDGKLVAGGPFQNDANGRRLVAFKMDNELNFNGTYLNTGQGNGSPVQWLQISDDGTNRKWNWSGNGYDWINIGSEGRTTFLTADQVGFFTNGSSTGLTLLHWLET